jgi:AcrR family transcriptional regulator
MAPPRNTRRRNALADAAIEVLGTVGIHKLSHRAVDERAEVPAGTAANYFPRRYDLLAAAAERVADLALADMAAANQGHAEQAGSAHEGTPRCTSGGFGGVVPPGGTAAAGVDTLTGLIGAALYDAATRHRTRYLAAYELALESTRQPELAAAMSRLGAGALGTTIAGHGALGLATTPEQVQALIALYNGTLLTLIVAPPGTVTAAVTAALARCIVTGAWQAPGG